MADKTDGCSPDLLVDEGDPTLTAHRSTTRHLALPVAARAGRCSRALTSKRAKGRSRPGPGENHPALPHRSLSGDFETHPAPAPVVRRAGRARNDLNENLSA